MHRGRQVRDHVADILLALVVKRFDEAEARLACFDPCTFDP